MLRGEIWIATWPTDPHKKKRPILIVSNNHRNSAKHLFDIVVVKLTSLIRNDGTKKPVNAVEDVVVKLKKDTIIRCGAIFSIEKTILKNKIMTLSTQTMEDVDQCLKQVLNL